MTYIATFCLGAIAGMVYTFLAYRHIQNRNKKE